MTHTSETNPLGLNGIEFIEFASPDPQHLHNLFTAFGFSKTMKHQDWDIDYYGQNRL